MLSSFFSCTFLLFLHLLEDLLVSSYDVGLFYDKTYSLFMVCLGIDNCFGKSAYVYCILFNEGFASKVLIDPLFDGPIYGH